MPQLNIYYGNGPEDTELIEHLRQMKAAGGQISAWVKRACWMRLQTEQKDATQDKLDRILEKLERLESGGFVIASDGDDALPSDQEDIDDFFKSAMESFE